MMTLVKRGSIGDCLPSGFSANLAAAADLQARLDAQLKLVADLQLRLADALTLSLTLPAVTVAASLSYFAAANAQLKADVQMPAFTTNLGALVADVKAEIALAESLSAELSAKLAVVASLKLTFGTAGVALYEYSGPLEDFGAELAAYTAGAPGDAGVPQNDKIAALVFTTNVPGVDTALKLAMGA